MSSTITPSHRIQKRLDPADLQDITNATLVIKTKLVPQLPQMTPDERKSTSRVGDRAEVFFKKGLDYANSDPDFAPRAFDRDGLKDDVDAAEQIDGLLRPLEQAVDLLRDCRRMARAGAFDTARKYYKGVQMAVADQLPGAEHVAADLGRAFEGQGGTRGGDVPGAPAPAPGGEEPALTKQG